MAFVKKRLVFYADKRVFVSSEITLDSLSTDITFRNAIGFPVDAFHSRGSLYVLPPLEGGGESVHALLCFGRGTAFSSGSPPCAVLNLGNIDCHDWPAAKAIMDAVAASVEGGDEEETAQPLPLDSSALVKKGVTKLRHFVAAKLAAVKQEPLWQLRRAEDAISYATRILQEDAFKGKLTSAEFEGVVAAEKASAAAEKQRRLEDVARRRLARVQAAAEGKGGGEQPEEGEEKEEAVEDPEAQAEREEREAAEERHRVLEVARLNKECCLYDPAEAMVEKRRADWFNNHCLRNHGRPRCCGGKEVGAVPHVWAPEEEGWDEEEEEGEEGAAAAAAAPSPPPWTEKVYYFCKRCGNCYCHKHKVDFVYVAGVGENTRRTRGRRQARG